MTLTITLSSTQALTLIPNSGDHKYPPCDRVKMSDIYVEVHAQTTCVADNIGASNHHEQQHIDTMMDSMVDPTGPHTGAEESASADLEAANRDPISELPVATSAAQPTDGSVNVAAVEPQMKRDPGLLPNLSTAAISASLASILQPTPKGLYSDNLLIVAYTWDVIMLLVLGILLYGLTFALDKVPDKWLGPLRAIMTAVACALLLLLLLLAAFVGYGLIFVDIHH